MLEAVDGVRGCDGVEDGLHGVPEVLAGAGGQAAEQLLDLAEHRLDPLAIDK